MLPEQIEIPLCRFNADVEFGCNIGAVDTPASLQPVAHPAEPPDYLLDHFTSCSLPVLPVFSLPSRLPSPVQGSPTASQAVRFGHVRRWNNGTASLTQAENCIYSLM